MIFYFSGTGNSLYVAQELATALGDTLYDMTSSKPLPMLTNDESVGFVFPIYAWGLPRVVESFVKQLSNACGERYVYGVFTCGDDVGYTDNLLRKALCKRGWHLNAAYSVQMRNTYVCLPGFDVDTTEVVERKRVNAEKRLPYIARCITQRAKVSDEELTRGAVAWIKSYVLRPLFNRFLIDDKRFWTQRAAYTKCGRCVKVCPLQNIHLNNEGVVEWKGNCTHCLRCYHACPRHAINYGKFTRNKGQVKINV